MHALTLAAVAALSSAPAPAPSPEALALAREMMQTTHRAELARDTYAKQLRASMLFCKSDAKCQTDLDRAIGQAASEVAQKYVESMTQILARKLTISQMQAALKFDNSPDGQAILAVQNGLSDEMAQIGMAAAAYAQKSIAQSFCPAHPEICVNDVGQRAPQPPKS